jgi:Icc protein
MRSEIIHLTDLHLFCDPSAQLKGICTRKTLRDVLARVRARQPYFRWLVLTGDMAHDEELETYTALRELLGDWVHRCRLVPGNHDHRGHLRSMFPEIVPGGDGPLTFSLYASGWRLVGLDTHIPGQLFGGIDANQLDWLDHELADHAAEPTMLFMHHPPIPIGTPWLDQLALHNPRPLIDLLSGRLQVKLICTGHVHHDSEHSTGHARVFTTPSTSVQFVPGTGELAVDKRPAGYRVVVLEGATYTTQVVRCEPPAAHAEPGIDDQECSA